MSQIKTEENPLITDLLSTAKEYRKELGENYHDQVVEDIYNEASHIVNQSVTVEGDRWTFRLDRTIDRIVTSRIFGFPIMLALLGAVLWLTIVGANYPSELLSELLLGKGHLFLTNLFTQIGAPFWLKGVIVDGVYMGTAWVVSVMLPPMAIFFPLFTLLEDYGYLPRVAFNLDNLFRKSGAHGKQALTMSMGFGCNAAGIVATRIIDSPRERLIAIITNNFSLCNGRWPTQILIASIFIGEIVPSSHSKLFSSLAVVAIVLLGIFLTFLVSFLLSKTLLKGEGSFFVLELPPYRPPQILHTIYKSVIDRTLIVLWRAVVFAAPSGALIWIVGNLTIGGEPIALIITDFLNPFGLFIGLNGIILLTYIIAIPANEIVIPTIFMLTTLTLNTQMGISQESIMMEAGLNETSRLLRQGGWTLLTGINLMIFSLLHNPCSTTLYTIYKETKSAKWTWISALLPTVMGIVLCMITAMIYRSFVH